MVMGQVLLRAPGGRRLVHLSYVPFIFDRSRMGSCFPDSILLWYLKGGYSFYVYVMYH